MESLVKTKAVSKKLSVNPTTIQRWVKYFDIPCPKNDHGHYLFRSEDIEQLEEIQKQLNQGLQMSDIKLQKKSPDDKVPLKKANGLKELDVYFQQLQDQLNILESKVSQKADEVLSYQVMQHRKDMDQMATRLTELEEKMLDLEEQLLLQVTATNEIRTEYSPPKPKKRNWLVSLF
ncbi:MerR family transcriptional regulator [Pseudalkalibacillus salsuginis]|uniref:MerR family transcriptional regulator n=1 Tax=Pseudalkalibacillus salsuginis TaxID=2910972 RepID=UPI001F2F0F6B|nr:MerR family transcriptional regulator [Pseudalkalibacillus salsuginis]MCF6408192.1 MerR family transcriptional regulator [Pseudalkalibacillus salsuginis]